MKFKIALRRQVPVNMANWLFSDFPVYRMKFEICLFFLFCFSETLAMFKIKIIDAYVIPFHGVINTNAGTIMFLKLSLIFVKHLFL